MPRISAPTVVEHRAAQRTALISAGEKVLAEAGLAGFTPRSVCEKAGLSRSSFYDYFPSKDDLLVAIAMEAIEQWDAEMEAILAPVEPGEAELRAFVEATMTMSADGRHALASVLREADLSPSRMDDLMALHDALMRPVHRVLDHLGIDVMPSTATLVQGVLAAGVQLVSHGVDPKSVSDDVFRMLTRGLLL